MGKKSKRFADDGWAIWVDGDDTSTVYLNDWLSPKGDSFIDIAVRIRGVRETKALNIYFPFEIKAEELTDVSLKLKDERLLRAIFSSMCVIDYKKNECTSEIAYNGKTVDIVHISTLESSFNTVSKGTLLKTSFERLLPCLDNDEAYFLFRVPHKTIDKVLNPGADVKKTVNRMRDLIMSPILSERFGYSVRINEARLLPKEINAIGAFHRQKLKKAVVTISIADGYELNDAGCYKIRRLEDELYKEYLPERYIAEDVITYQWQQSREESYKGNFNFYFNISRDSLSHASMLLYTIILVIINAAGGMLWDAIKYIYSLLG